MEFTARRYDTGQVVTVSIDDGRIDSITHADGPDSQNLPWVSPGFVDLQINGYGGQEFNDLTLDTERVAQVSLANDADGVTSYLPTLTTQSAEMLCHGMQAIATACEEDPRVAKRVIGIHLEGPYLSDQDGPRGAHPKEHCRAPDWDEFQRFPLHLHTSFPSALPLQNLE